VRGTAYEADYSMHGLLHALATAKGATILAVTHTKKGATGDWLEAITGSSGITGAADTVWVLKRDRGQMNATLRVTGRDVRDSELALKLDGGLWTCMGDATELRMHDTRKRIFDALAEAGPKGLIPSPADRNL
jgi:hypothetical protein